MAMAKRELIPATPLSGLFTTVRKSCRSEVQSTSNRTKHHIHPRAREHLRGCSSLCGQLRSRNERTKMQSKYKLAERAVLMRLSAGLPGKNRTDKQLSQSVKSEHGLGEKSGPKKETKVDDCGTVIVPFGRVVFF